MLPADAFGPMVGLASGSGAYKQLARLRSQGLAEVRDEDLGFLFGDRRRGLWRVTDLGRRTLRDFSEQRDPDRLAREARQQQRLHIRHLPLRVACYRLLAWFLVQGREQGDAYVVQGWESPWVAEFHPAEHDRPVRVKLPAAAYVISQSEPHPSLSSSRRLLLLPDLGTAPVARHGEVVRRLIIHNEHVQGRPGEGDELLVVTPDPDGRGTRMAAWCELLARVARRQQAEPPPSQVLSWARVSARVGGSATSALVAVRRNGAALGHLGRSDREQVLHLLGRHPLLTMGQLARLLGTTRGRIEGFEREMIDLGWLRTLDLGDLGVSGLDLGEFAPLGLVELTNVGRRRLADMLGLDSPTASRYHGLTGSGLAGAARRRRLLRALAHTLGTNDVFVAFALAAAEARRRGYVDELSEWRGAAACERRRCKPDGYGLYTRHGVGYGFLLEYDRGTESARKYAAKFRAYYHYRDSGQAARDYNGLPTILFVTTSTSAEDRIADQAHRAWFIRCTDPLAVQITSTDRIAADREGILGPIWRTPALAHGTLDVDRHYWLPGGPPARCVRERAEGAADAAARVAGR
jgi:Replication-relaxation